MTDRQKIALMLAIIGNMAKNSLNQHGVINQLASFSHSHNLELFDDNGDIPDAIADEFYIMIKEWAKTKHTDFDRLMEGLHYE